MAVSAERLTINPGLGDGVNGLGARQTEELGDHSGSGDLDEDNVVETNTVEGVLESQASLDLVGLDHGLKNVLDLGNLDSGGRVGLGSTSKPVSDGKDTAQVVGGMAPLGSEPAIIVVEPADGSANVEGTTDGVELIGSTGNLGTVGDDGACFLLAD